MGKTLAVMSGPDFDNNGRVLAVLEKHTRVDKVVLDGGGAFRASVRAWAQVNSIPVCSHELAPDIHRGIERFRPDLLVAFPGTPDEVYGTAERFAVHVMRVTT